MKNLRFLPLLFIISFLSSCGDKISDTGKLDINFKMTYDGVPLQLLKKYKYPDGKSLFFNRFSFMVSEIELANSSGSTQKDETIFVNLGDSHSTEAGVKAGQTISLDGLTTGNYTKFKMCIGVPRSKNAKSPADFQPTDPLSQTAEYWAGWKSYIFARTEGFIDTNNDGVENQGFSLHTGADEAYICFNNAINIEITDEANMINVNFDLKKLFQNGTEIYDIKANPQIHSLSQSPQVKILSNNLLSSLSTSN
jgi:hypothetical protein